MGACTADGGGGGCPSGANCLDVVRNDATPTDAPTDATPQPDGPPTTNDVPPVDARGPVGEVREVRIEPSEITIRSTNATRMPTQRFAAVGVRADGSTIPLTNALWSLADDRLGAVSATGEFTANGVAGGRVELNAEVPTGSGTVAGVAQVTVRIERDERVGDLPEALPARIAMATPMEGGAVVHYPLDGAVMPNNVLAPEVQWEPAGGSGDVFRVRIQKPNLSVSVYVSHTGTAFTHAITIPDAIWRLAVESDPLAPMTIAVDRWDGAEAILYGGAPVSVRVTTSSIAGAIYYWDLNSGAIQRLDQGSRMAVPAIANPPRRPSDDRQCVACHTVSRDGRFLAAELWDGGDFGTVFDLTADPSATPSTTLFPPDRFRWQYSTFNADSTRMLANGGFGLELIDPRLGMSVVASGMPTRAAQPEWSPRGNNVAMVTNVEGVWSVDYTQGDLGIVPVTSDDAFGEMRVAVPGASLSTNAEGGVVISHPTWSPDSRFVAFGHGTHSRSYSDGVNQPGALYVVSSEAGGTPFRLDRANGGAMGVNSYWPTFSPFTTQDRGTGRTYFWLAFHSRRDFGNARAGTRGTNRPQLWVTAVDTMPRPGIDPSNVPYHISGQNTGDSNMAALWTAQPCRTNGSTCASSGDCCSGLCRPDADMPERVVCVPPPPAMCRREGQTCGGASDCCMGLDCVGNVCLAPPG